MNFTRAARPNSYILLLFSLFALMFFFAGSANAHDVSSYDKALLANKPGVQFILYAWLGAKHMVTGYDHLLFLLGITFYLGKIKDISVFVSLFAIGHTITLLSAVLFNLDANINIVDAIIGLSVAYKGFDNLKGFQMAFGAAPDERIAVFVFGLFHGLGLGSKLQELGLQPEGLVPNLLAFNIGVEAGQFAGLIIILIILRLISPIKDHKATRVAVNSGLIVAGLLLMIYQLVQI